LAEPAMTREQFVIHMATIGYTTEESIKDWVKLNKLGGIGGVNKYDRYWEIANVNLDKASGE
jgi:hypothetical protein